MCIVQLAYKSQVTGYDIRTTKYESGAGGRTRTGTDKNIQWILSPLRLPFRHSGLPLYSAIYSIKENNIFIAYSLCFVKFFSPSFSNKIILMLLREQSDEAVSSYSFLNTISALFCYSFSSGKILYITSPFLARPSFSRANFSR